MASSVLGMIKEEVTCPICLELLKEPVSADCDHIFCRVCITLNYESSKGKEGEGICPVCRDSYLFGNLRPNWQMANIVERLKGFKTSPEEEQKVNVCAQHGEKLQLFCEKDMVAICWLCERSQEHCGHQTALIEEVANKYKRMLQAALEMQMANEKRCDQWEDDLQKERTSWEGVNHVLTRSQNLRLKQPKIFPRRQKRIFRVPDLKGILQVFQGLLDARCHWVHVTLRQIHNKNIVINEDKRQIQHRNANRGNSQISKTYNLGVLGYPAIHSGKHYWEVDVSGCDAWLLGINDGRCARPQLPAANERGFKVKYNSDVKRDVNYWLQIAIDSKYKHDFGDKQNVNYQPKHEVKDDSDDKQHVNYQPKWGYWVIGMRSRSVYNAFEECSVTHNASVLLLSLTCPPTRVGVFLDREACTLSFYDVSNHGALIYRFCELNFPDAVYPYFNPMMSLEPLTVCGPPS